MNIADDDEDEFHCWETPCDSSIRSSNRFVMLGSRDETQVFAPTRMRNCEKSRVTFARRFCNAIRRFLLDTFGKLCHTLVYRWSSVGKAQVRIFIYRVFHDISHLIGGFYVSKRKSKFYSYRVGQKFLLAHFFLIKRQNIRKELILLISNYIQVDMISTRI